MKTNRSVEAYVEHSSGKKVVSASTKEKAISKHLYRSVSFKGAISGFLIKLLIKQLVTVSMIIG